MIELEKNYNASEHEQTIYKLWLDSGKFNPDNLEEAAEPFTIIMPPPNVTGTLHVGHALFVTIQDTLIRRKRMQGYKALWLPGTDHAAIATQSKVEKLLFKYGIRRSDLGREQFLKKVEEFAQESHDTIINQLKGMGASADWSREAYTLDEPREKAVRTAFKSMYDDGLIYQENKVINWDVKGQTVISDDEVVHVERDAKLYTFKYSHDFPIAIATTRPETKLGDTAVAVHPDDKRYQQFIGQTIEVEDFCGEKLSLKIIADEHIDPEFGTGALGVTPAHSMVDAEMAERNNLPFIQVINEFGKMTVGSPEIIDTKTTVAREVIADWLKQNNLLEKEEDIKQNVATAERTGGIIEPLPKKQWFIAVNKPFILKHSELDGIESGQEVTLKQLMKQVIQSSQISVNPDRFSKTYFHWIDNLRDWCISRQIWYGHRIPVWYKGAETYCGVEAPDGDGWEQDPDTLDTWFSSGLWTFSTLGWPDQTKDLKTFHPTDVLETGYDILFFWIARMILMSTYNTGQIPFKNIYLHGMVRDDKNRKMSKSLGNIIDPLDMNEKYGTDALRFALIFNTAPGTDMALAENKIKGMKHFGNKIWNISRFVLANLEGKPNAEVEPQTDADKLILEQLKETITISTKALDEFRLHEAAQKLYDFVWHDFADVYLEASKSQLENESTRTSTQAILFHCLTTSFKLLHPFMPFLTETLWQTLYNNQLVEEPLLMIAKWPTE
ncbi:MAG: valine--tRNA ligase [Candidatus Doudnabacteria bacterium]